MTIEETIDKCYQVAGWLKELENLRIENSALHIAIAAGMDYPGWIPCSESMPENEDPVLVTCQFIDVDWKWEEPHIRILEYMPKYGHWNIKEPVNVLAWMPLPTMYNPDMEDKE